MGMRQKREVTGVWTEIRSLISSSPVREAAETWGDGGMDWSLGSDSAYRLNLCGVREQQKGPQVRKRQGRDRRLRE